MWCMIYPPDDFNKYKWFQIQDIIIRYKMKRMSSMQTDQRLQRLVLQSAIAQKRSHRWIFTSNQRICTTTTRRSWRFFLIKANQDKVMESHQPRHQYHLKRWEGIKWITATGPFIMFKINTIILIWTTHQWSVAASHWGPNVSTVRHNHRPKHSAFVIIPATVGVSRKTFCHDETQRGVS